MLWLQIRSLLRFYFSLTNRECVTDIPDVFRERFGDPEEARRQSQSFPVVVHALNTSAKLIGGSPESRVSLLEFVPWAEAMAIPHLRVFDGGVTRNLLDEEALSEAAAFFEWWRSLRNKNHWKVDVIIETHGALCQTSAIRQLQEALPEPAPLLWDSHHTWRKGGEAPEETWRAISPWVRHIHYKDSISKPSTRHPYTYVLPGHGEMDLASLFDMLKGDSYEGPLSLEWEKQWHPELPSLEEALDACVAAGW